MWNDLQQRVSLQPAALINAVMNIPVQLALGEAAYLVGPEVGRCKPDVQETPMSEL